MRDIGYFRALMSLKCILVGFGEKCGGGGLDISTCFVCDGQFNN